MFEMLDIAALEEIRIDLEGLVVEFKSIVKMIGFDEDLSAEVDVDLDIWKHRLGI